MRQRMTRRWVYLGTMLAMVAAMAIVPLGTQSAPAFANPAFERQWTSVESVIPNFWGPAYAAAAGTNTEPYTEGSVNGQPGARLVQYFDKARMELTNPATGTVTNGLLTVELKTGQLQLGDQNFSGLSPAQIGIAGDPGQPGPTYATLGILSEREQQRNGAVSLTYNLSTNGFINGTPSTDGEATFTTYLGDPNGRFGQNVPKAFADFLERIPGGYLSAMGYPISPAFQATITLGGQAGVPVIIQAFQRKVLTYTPSNQPAFQVEFGNIGQHYYTWRTAQGNLPAATTSATSTATATATGTATTTATPTVTTTPVVVTATSTATALPTQTAVVVTATSTATALPTQTAVVVTATATTIPTVAATTAVPTATPMPTATLTAMQMQTATAMAITATPSPTPNAQPPTHTP